MNVKLKDFIKKDVDIDVVDNVTEQLYIGFCGPIKLTDYGRKHFENILDLDVEIKEDIAIVDVDVNDSYDYYLEKACEFFHCAAGYCSLEKYGLLFED